MAAEIKLETADDRTAAGKGGAEEYVKELTDIAGALNKDEGQSLGTLVENQLKMTEAESNYNVKTGIPGKATKSVNEASQSIKRQGG